MERQPLRSAADVQHSAFTGGLQPIEGTGPQSGLADLRRVSPMDQPQPPFPASELEHGRRRISHRAAGRPHAAVSDELFRRRQAGGPLVGSRQRLDRGSDESAVQHARPGSGEWIADRRRLDSSSQPGH